MKDIPKEKDLFDIMKLKDYIRYDKVFISEDPSYKEMNQTYKEILELCDDLTKRKIPHMLTFYGGGHGVTNLE